MEYLLGLSWGVFMAIFGGLVGLKWLLRSVNCWVYETNLGEKRFNLPPGDMGWPFIGNMWSFLRAFKSTNPDSFISSFVSRNQGVLCSLVQPSVLCTRSGGTPAAL